MKTKTALHVLMSAYDPERTLKCYKTYLTDATFAPCSWLQETQYHLSDMLTPSP